jgi:hypothetical protein
LSFLAGSRKEYFPVLQPAARSPIPWKKPGWDIEDYLPHCGISSTASAFGLARAFLTKKSTLVVHGNHHASGRQALVAAVTK